MESLDTIQVLESLISDIILLRYKQYLRPSSSYYREMLITKTY